MNNTETSNTETSNTEIFNKILYEKLFENSESEDDDNNICLITMDNLDKNSINLVCGHKFNYEPLFKEIENQKKKNMLEITKLSSYQIKCPYCRTNIDNNKKQEDKTNYYLLIEFPLNNVDNTFQRKEKKRKKKKPKNFTSNRDRGEYDRKSKKWKNEKVKEYV